MNDTPVYNRNQILRTILNGPKSVNNIVKDTGIYKKYVLERYLPIFEKAALVTRSKDRKIHKQKEFLRLTDLGVELAELLDSMDVFDKLHLELRNKIKQTFNDSAKPTKQKKASKSLHRSKGLGEQEINSYNINAEMAWYFEKKSLSICIDVLKTSYAYIISKFSPNDSANDLLLKTFANMIDKYTLMELESLGNEINHYFSCKDCGHELPVSKEIQDDQKSALILIESCRQMFEFIKQHAPLIFADNSFISKETRNVISSLFSICNPPKEFLEVLIKAEAETEHPTNENSNRHNQVLSFYRELKGST